MLTATNISAGYGGKSAVESISFTLSEGQWLMICGPNGAGKSTLMKAVTGVLPCTGEVLIADRDMRHMRPAELAREVGVLSQRTHSEYDFTVEQVVALGRYAHRGSFLRPSDSAGAAKITEALAAVGLLEKRTRPLGALSGGEVQRVFLAQVFAQEPRILILDEPANHLDVTYQKQLFDLINDWRRAPGRAVITVVHDLNLARMYGTHALLLNSGRAVAQGEIRQALTRASLTEAYSMDVLSWLKSMLTQWESEE